MRRYLVSVRKYVSDKKLEQHIVEFLYEEGNLRHIITDCLYYHNIDDPNHIVLKKRNATEFKMDFGEESEKCLSSLKEISNCLSKKNYSDDHLAARIFLDEQKTPEYFNYNLKVAHRCLENYLKESKELVCLDDYMDNPLMRGKLAFIAELLIDLSTIVNHLYSWKRARYEIYLKNGKISKSEMLFENTTLPHAIMRKRICSQDVIQNLQCSMRRTQFYDNVTAVSVAMFQIRQMIELRLWEIFGIDSIVDNKENLVKLTADKLLDIPGLEKNVNFHAKLSNIKLIHSWTNIYVHAGISTFNWHIDFAYHYLVDFVLKPSVIRDEYVDNLDENLNKNLCSGNYHINYRTRKDMITVSEEQRKKDFEERMACHK